MKRIITLMLAVMLVLAVSAPVFADTYVPSVENKPAPEVTAPVVVDKDGKEVPAEGGAVEVTSMAAATGEEKADLVEAKAVLDEAKSLADVCPALAGGSVKPEDMIVKDLFDVSVTGTYADALAAGGKVTVVLKASGVLAVLHWTGSAWESLPFKAVDGGIEVTFSSLSPVALVYENAKLPGGGPDGPATGEAMSFAPVFMVCGLVAVAAAAAVVMKKKAA